MVAPAGAGFATASGTQPPPIDGRQSWLRLAIAIALSTIGGAGMWAVVVVMPSVQAEFGIGRSSASLPYTVAMLGVAFGGMLMGRLSDQYGIVPVTFMGGVLLGIGFLTASLAPNIMVFTLAYGILIGIGCSASFGPLLADISFWFQHRRGIAVALVASGNYLAGTFWPPVVQRLDAAYGWRTTFVILAIVCFACILPMALALRWRSLRPLAEKLTARQEANGDRLAASGLSPGFVQGLLLLAGIGCCVAMSMPQVHIVAYCGDLGYGPARGAEMLALMFGFGIISRVASGFVADRIGGLMTLLIGSALQCVSLVLYLFFDSLVSLYVVSALFGLFQGGIVPCYAIVVREVFRPEEAGRRVGMCIGATLVGMALGGWMSGWVFDLTGTYRAAFANGIAWNLVNQAILLLLLWRLTRPGEDPRPAVPA